MPSRYMSSHGHLHCHPYYTKTGLGCGVSVSLPLPLGQEWPLQADRGTPRVHPRIYFLPRRRTLSRYTSLNLPAASGRRRLFIMATISASTSTSAKRARHPQGPHPVFHLMTHPSHLHRHRPAMIQGRIPPAHPCHALAPLAVLG